MSVPVLSRLFVASGATEVILRPSAEDTQPSAVTTEAVQAADRQSLVSKRRTASPTLRASSFPEVTNPFCRLPLSTLFYRLEAVHLGDLMRLWVRPGKIDTLPRIFTDRRRRAGHRQKCGAVPASEPNLRMTRFQGRRAVKKKRKLFPGPTPASPGSLTLPSNALSR